MSIKSFSKYFEELSPDTYDKIKDAGLQRNDPRGNRIADTADKLKFRPYDKEVIMYKIDRTGEDTRFTHKTAYFELEHGRTEANKNDVVKVIIGDVAKKAGNDFLSIGDVGGQIHITETSSGLEVINHNGRKLMFDRKSAGIITRMLNDLTSIRIKPNDLKQF